ncbi:MAG: transposase [Acidithiobacillales bacterium]
MARCEDYASIVELLSTIPGIGWLTALTLVVEIVDFSRFPDGEAFSSYAGLTPSEHSSGERIRHGHITRQGNPVLRSVLVESSWILIAKDPEMRRFYERIKLRRGGKRAIARECPSRICPKYASRSQPSMGSLALIATTAGTARERVSRVARYACPNPPWPSRLSIRY